MKQILLILSFTLLILPAFGQNSKCIGCPKGYTLQQDKISISIYPNPVHDYFKINSNVSISGVLVYNLFGGKEEVFKAETGKQYNISNLRTGMYLIQLLDENGAVFSTKRITKR